MLGLESSDGLGVLLSVTGVSCVNRPDAGERVEAPVRADLSGVSNHQTG